MACPAYAEPAFTEANIVKAIAGEAGGQGQAEIVAIAHAIANRGHLRGVYGIRSKVSPKALKRAKKGYMASLRTPDTVKGADHWLSDYDLAHCRPALIAFRFKMVETAYIGSTHFYKERK